MYTWEQMTHVRYDINYKKGFQILMNLYLLVFVFIIEKLYLSHFTEMFRLCDSQQSNFDEDEQHTLCTAIYSFFKNCDIDLQLHCWHNASLPWHSFLEQMPPGCVIGAVSHDYAQYLS